MAPAPPVLIGEVWWQIESVPSWGSCHPMHGATLAFRQWLYLLSQPVRPGGVDGYEYHMDMYLHASHMIIPFTCVGGGHTLLRLGGVLRLGELVPWFGGIFPVLVVLLSNH